MELVAVKFIRNTVAAKKNVKIGEEHFLEKGEARLLVYMKRAVYVTDEPVAVEDSIETEIPVQLAELEKEEVPVKKSNSKKKVHK